jgi:hypothetical protein
MSVEVVKLLAEHAGILGVLIGVPFLAMSSVIVVLWRRINKNEERMLKLIEQKVAADIKLENTLSGLKEVILKLIG